MCFIAEICATSEMPRISTEAFLKPTDLLQKGTTVVWMEGGFEFIYCRCQFDFCFCFLVGRDSLECALLQASTSDF